MEKIKKILIPTDFSKTSDEAISYGCNLAQALKAEVILLRVLEKKEALADEKFHETQKAMDIQLLLDIPPSVQADIKVEKRIVSGSPLEDILKTANGEKVDMIVMRQHYKAGAFHRIKGCLVDKILREAPCPVMTIHKLEEGEKIFNISD